MSARNNKHASQGNRVYKETCLECIELKKEETKLEAYRGVMKNDMTDVLRAELGTWKDQTKIVNALHHQNMPYKNKHGKIIYIVPRLAIFSAISIIAAFLTWIILLIIK